MAGRIDKAECRVLRAKGWTLKRLAERYGVSKPAVCKACEGITCGIDHSLVGARASIAKRSAARVQKRDRARLLFEDGYGPREIAPMVGCSVSLVYDYIRDLRLKQAPIQVPAWVPADLRDTFEKMGRRRGEEVAASFVRRLKSEAAACR